MITFKSFIKKSAAILSLVAAAAIALYAFQQTNYWLALAAVPLILLAIWLHGRILLTEARLKSCWEPAGLHTTKRVQDKDGTTRRVVLLPVVVSAQRTRGSKNVIVYVRVTPGKSQRDFIAKADVLRSALQADRIEVTEGPKSNIVRIAAFYGDSFDEPTELDLVESLPAGWE